MNQTEEIRAKLSEKDRAVLIQRDRHKAFRAKLDKWHEVNGSVLDSLIGSPDDAVRLWLASRATLSATPQLLDTDANSFATCLVMSAQMRLYPGPSQECALVPMAGQTVWWPMYKGLIKLGTMSRQVRSVDALEVCENDEFDVVWGQRPKLHHRIDYRMKREDRGRIIAVYATYELTNAKRAVFEVMSWEDVMAIKADSPSVKRNRPSPWTASTLSEIEMAKKTVLKRGYKTIPTSPELAYVIAIDNVIETQGRARTNPVDINRALKAEDVADPVVMPEADYSEVQEEQVAEEPQQPAQQAIEHQERISVSVPTESREPEVLEAQGGGISGGKLAAAQEWAQQHNAVVITHQGPVEMVEEPFLPDEPLDAEPAPAEKKSAAQREFERIKERAAKEREKAQSAKPTDSP